MKKLFIIVAIMIGCLTLSGCTNEELPLEQLPKEEMINELKIIESNLVYVWNDCLVMLSWYSMEGTDPEGKELDINNVVSKLKLYYEDFDKYDKRIQTLSDTYKDLKTSWNKTYEELKVVYKAVLEKTPVANEKLTYKSNIDAYEGYMSEYRTLLENIAK